MASVAFQNIVSRYQTAIKDNVRHHANYYSERNFIGDRRAAINGVAGGGAVQLRRLFGVASSTSTVVGE